MPEEIGQDPALVTVPGSNMVDPNLTAVRQPSHQNRYSSQVDSLPRLSATLLQDSENTPISDLSEKSVPFDFERTLQEIFKKIDTSDVKRRELGVMFQNLRVVGMGATVSIQPTVGSLLNPKAIWEDIQNSRHPHVRDILSGFEGVVRPGEMLLVLGSPGSGCTSFLKTLANRRNEFHAVEGEVRYGPFSPEEIAKNYRGDLQYCPEDDVHFPTLTVEETIRFAVKTRAPHARVAGQTRADYINTMTDILMTVFGLSHVRNTLVGDASIRGISGGEKKRVSIAEALALRSVINTWDNSTRGLDSSTAVEFSRALRTATDIARTSTIVSIYQASDSVYEIFDKVCLIYQGKMAYYGPANLARKYFIDMGYEPANRQTTADFLVSVTDSNARILLPGFENTAPRTADEFFSYYQRSNIAQMNRADMESYRREFIDRPEGTKEYMASFHADHATTISKKSPYIISIPMQIKAVMVRRMQILKGGSAAEVANIFAFVFQAIIFGTLFLRLPTNTAAFFSRGGALFFIIFFLPLTAQVEIPALFKQRPIVARHEKAAMYHPFIEAAALTVVDFAVALIILAIYSVVLYFLVGLQSSVSQYFIFLLILYSVSFTSKNLIRSVAAASGDVAPAQTLSGLFMMCFVLYTGYTIPMPSMIGALKWITYINPLRYAFEGILTNEFHTLSATCSFLVPTGPGYQNVSMQNQVCATLGSVPGQNLVDGNAFASQSYTYFYSNLWRNIGIVLGMGVAFLVLLLVLTEINCDISERRVVISFKRGVKAPTIAVNPGDEEKGRNRLDSDAVIPNDSYEAKNIDNKPPPMTNIFSWKHLMYTVTVSGGNRRKLLNDVSGYVAPGKLTALMGESGAGKTTLLNVLAQRTDTGVIDGDVFVNGQKLPVDFQAQTGYCQQLDTHVPQDTVREAILFSAMLRQPRSVPKSEKEAFVETCIVTCGLEKYAEAIVGTLNAESLKRLTIAVELAAKPKLLLFLDEPTSGLDSQSAWAILSFLRSLADNGQAILCTIHQPSSELLQVFDRLLLLRKGGETVYFGDLGHNSSTMIDYFERNGARKCAPTENPAEYMLEVIGAGATATSEIDWYNAVWTQSPEHKAALEEIDAIHSSGKARPFVATERHSEFSTSWMDQMTTLLVRDLKVHWRDPTYVMSKFVLNIIAGLFTGFTFWKAKGTIQGTQNKLFAIFTAMLLSFTIANQLQVPFIDMRKIYEIRERPSRMYSFTALLTSQILAELPFNIIGSTLSLIILYWIVGFSASRLGYIVLIMVVFYPTYYTTAGQAIAATSPDANVAGIVFSVLFSFVVIFNGVLQPYSLLGWWKWMYWVSPYTYFAEGVMTQLVGRQQINCAASEFVNLNPPSGLTCNEYLGPFMSSKGGYLTNPNATTMCQFCAYRTTDEWMAGNFHMFYSNRWRDLGVFIAFSVFNIFALFACTYLFRIRKWTIPRFLRRASK